MVGREPMAWMWSTSSERMATRRLPSVIPAFCELNSGNQVDAYGRPRTFGVDVVYEF